MRQAPDWKHPAPVVVYELSQSSCEIQVGENALIGINVGFAVRCKQNGPDTPESSGVARGKRVDQLAATAPTSVTGGQGLSLLPFQ